MRATNKTIAFAVMATCALLAGCRDKPAEAPDEEPGQAALYPDIAQAKQDIAAALAQADKENKRVLLDFGGNWCGDCQVLNIYFHAPANRALLDQNYVLVPVNVGHLDQNLDLATKYGVPLVKGVPALAVLDSKGELLYSQHNAEFESMGRVDPGAVTAFLLQWKG
jgi:thiol:disulfide interchange protein